MSDKKEYIERGALMEEIIKHIDTIGVNAERLVARFPAADVEPVVRCRDCEHSEEVDEESKTMFEGDPEFYCGHIDCPVDGNGFCSAGKRKAHTERSGSGE